MQITNSSMYTFIWAPAVHTKQLSSYCIYLSNLSPYFLLNNICLTLQWSRWEFAATYININAELVGQVLGYIITLLLLCFIWTPFWSTNIHPERCTNHTWIWWRIFTAEHISVTITHIKKKLPTSFLPPLLLPPKLNRYLT